MLTALYGLALYGKYRAVGPATVALLFQGLQAQAPSPSFAEETYAYWMLANTPDNYKFDSGGVRAAGQPKCEFGVFTAAPSDVTPSIQTLIAFAWE